MEVPWKTIDDVKIQERLGGGAFGEVYRGVWQGGDVALKKLMAEDEKGFLNEAHVLQKLYHPNVVRYIGIHKAEDKSLYIVMEYLPLGSLNKLLMKPTKLSTTDLIAMASQAAAGMVHLSSQNIIHRDLALRNVLVGTFGEDKKYIAKISDFGLSRSIESSYYKSRENIPIKWSAPEVLEFGVHTIKSDVYSFGVMLWEMFSYGKLPYSEFTNSDARKEIINGKKLPTPPNCPESMYMLMLRCWGKEADDRPTFNELLNEITKIWEVAKAEVGEKDLLVATIPLNNGEPLYATSGPDPEPYNNNSYANARD